MSNEHFTVDGTLIEGWASQKSFRRKDGRGNPPDAGGDVDFHGEKRKNETHASTTDPDARLLKKSKGSEAKLSYLGHVLMANRNRLLVQTFLTEANGRAEREAAMLMAEAIPAESGDIGRRQELRHTGICPGTARNEYHSTRGAKRHEPFERDQRTTRQAGYGNSQQKRK